jgi:hypothetical protein
MRVRLFGILAMALQGLLGIASPATPASAQEAAPASAEELGPLSVISGRYKLPASVDPSVTTALATELWAQVWRPDTGGPYPLVIFLHGNHGTCGRFDSSRGIRVDDRTDYTFSGTCPAGYVVTPSHLGYKYLSKSLASQGYVVVSINANRGVNAAPGVSGDAGLNLRRGRLVLRHMQELAKWNAGTATPPASLGFSLVGLLDFSHVGLMGHSRGGEGMRAAMAQYRDAGSPWPARIGPVGFEAVFEIGPVDGQTSRTLNAPDVDWNVLLPGCDGDVSDLEGVKPLDRMFEIGSESANFKKSSIEVFGANHNFYNTEWQLSDAGGCQGQAPLFPSFGGSADQRTTASVPLLKFFQAYVGAAPRERLGRIFDPSYALPSDMTDITQFARGFTPGSRKPFNFVVDDFDKVTGTSTKGAANQSSGLALYSHGAASSSHDATQRAASVDWNTPGGFLQLNDAAAGVPIDVSAFRTLEFRVALRCPESVQSAQSVCSDDPDPTGDVDFSISLANSNGTSSSLLPLKSYAVVRRPVGSSFTLNTILQTVRIPLADFTGANLSQFRGVRFTFNKTASSSVFLANVRLDKANAGPGGLDVALSGLSGSSSAVMEPISAAETNRIVAIRSTQAPSDSSGSQPAVEIELYSSRAFPIGGALPVLTIGTNSFNLSRFAGHGSHSLIFTLPDAQYSALQDGAEVRVKVGGSPPWDFGGLPKQ